MTLTNDRRPKERRVALTTAISGYWSVVEELRTIVTWLAAPGLWITLAAGLLLWTLAYQQYYSYRLNFGGDRATQRRYDDDPYLLDFNAPEPKDTMWLSNPDQLPYRWTQAVSTIRLPGIGGGT